jgi:3-methyladenine DNA glycosylase/8-oxoguanine DNA glycosylase
MSEMVSFPRYGASQAQTEVERAEAIINAFCKLYGRVAAPFTRINPAALDGRAPTIRRASVPPSA